jgi:SRSO17 transposase
MDAETILGIKPALTEYLRAFDDCMGRQSNRRHRDHYVLGQLSDLQRKSVEPIADAAGVPSRTLQEFLSMMVWDEAAMRDRLQQRVAARHPGAPGPHGIGIFDDTSFVKKGRQTAGVQRQHCGTVGKRENCVVSVHLGYAADDFHTLLDGELYLPEHTWHEDRVRCRAAGIPDDVVFRTKPQIALGQLRRALNNGVRFAWLTFDEGYGGNLPFLRELEGLGQTYVAEVPASFWGWTRCPEVYYQAHPRDRVRKGDARRKPKLKARDRHVGQVRNVLKHSAILRRVPWERFHVKDGTKGPMVFEAKRIPFWIRDAEGLPRGPYHLMVTRPVLRSDEIKFFISNALPDTSLEVLLLVGFSRWHIERLFEDSKSELGMSHFEVRLFPSLQRHLILSCLSHLFLAEYRKTQRGEKSGVDGLPVTHGHPAPGADLESRRSLQPPAGAGDQRRIEPNASAQRQSASRPPQGHAA